MKELLINVPTNPKTPKEIEQVKAHDEFLGELEKPIVEELLRLDRNLGKVIVEKE